MGISDSKGGGFVVAGHSHVFCMGAPHGYQGPISLMPTSIAGRDGYFLMEEWKGNRTQEYWQAVLKYSRDLQPIFIFGGNQHFGDFLLRSNPPFDVVNPAAPMDFLDGTIPVPKRLLEAHFSPSLDTLRSLLARIREIDARPAVVVGTPPPRRDIAAVIGHVRASPFFRKVAEERGLAVDEIELTPAAGMLRLWSITQHLLEEASRAGDAIFVPVAPEARDEDGYLRREFASSESDFTHANSTYGRLMLNLATKQTGTPFPIASNTRSSAQMPMASLTIDFSETGDSDLYTGAGWSRPESNGRWTVEAKAELRISGLDTTKSYRCEMLVGPFVHDPHHMNQQLQILCGGIPLYSETLTTGTFAKFVVPKAAISTAGAATLTLMSPNARSPASLGLSHDTRLLGVSVATARFDAFDSTDMPAPAIPKADFHAFAPVVISSPATPVSEATKAPVAAVTMVFNEPEYLPIWLRHYAKQVGIENCYVIDHGSTDGSTDRLTGCTVIRLPRSPYDPVLQSTYTAKFCSSLLCWYSRVLYCDVDEIVLADPLVAQSLSEYALRPLPEIVNVIGLNIIHRTGREPDIDLTQPITIQRPYVFACSPMCKPVWIARDVQWSGGSHSADAVVAFDHIYMFHLRWFDLPLGQRRLARQRAMAWADTAAGGHARVADEVYETMLRGFANLPPVDECDFVPSDQPIAPFLDEVTRSQAGREFDAYKIDLRIWWGQLWHLPPRFIGTF